ncbi:ThuA domain-containing protein [Gryllotalpicola ginsengisoli]|uniref:ThuA domain-containing protein n=1 Tax=Gryllotalpicola ginsengisoli TaxID=444608 RepID=UPI0003B3D6E8|nr:ThuA domain-containing protein [Gryllotalpicola ginsengisoli]
MATHAVVVSGAGRYADPWHPFAETSAQLAEILAEAGFDAEVDEAVDERLADPSGAELLVLNIGNPKDPHQADAAVRAGLRAHLESGRPLLAVHVSSTSLPGVPEWERMLGGIWVRGTTYHPPYGPSEVEIVDREHPITRPIADFVLPDERYTELRVDPGVRVLAQHTLDGVAHPLVWEHRYGPARVLYDALGHDAASFRSPEHRLLLRRAALWLVDSL